MSQIVGKGTLLRVSAANSYTSIGSLIDLETPTNEIETYDSDSLDNNAVGIPYAPTGRVEGGSCSGTMWLDTTAQSTLLGYFATPTTTHSYSILFSNNANCAFTGAGLSFGASVSLKEAVKAKFSIKVSGVATWT